MVTSKAIGCGNELHECRISDNVLGMYLISNTYQPMTDVANLMLRSSRVQLVLDEVRKGRWRSAIDDGVWSRKIGFHVVSHDSFKDKLRRMDKLYCSLP